MFISFRICSFSVSCGLWGDILGELDPKWLGVEDAELGRSLLLVAFKSGDFDGDGVGLFRNTERNDFDL